MNGADRWCILRTSGGKTLPLARSLAEAGFEVWTPVQNQVRRRPRSNATVQREMPIAPSFVFVRSDRLADIMALRSQPAKHPAHSVFRYAGRIPLIADEQIEGLRSAEQRAMSQERKSRRRKLVMGQRVRFSEGAFAGMSGVVQEQAGQFALVAFGGGFRVQIASWLIPEDGVQDDTVTPRGAAA